MTYNPWVTPSPYVRIVENNDAAEYYYDLQADGSWVGMWEDGGLHHDDFDADLLGDEVYLTPHRYSVILEGRPHIGPGDKPCEICAPGDNMTHTTEEHREDWVTLADPCDECGAGPHEGCKPNCPQQYL